MFFANQICSAINTKPFMPGVTSEKAKPKSFMSAEHSDGTKLLGFMFAEGSAYIDGFKLSAG